MKALGTLAAITTLGLAGCSYEPSFSEVYLNSPIVDGYDLVIKSGKNLRIGNLINEENLREGFWTSVLHVQGDFNRERIRIDAMYPSFFIGHQLEKFVSREELERVVKEVKRGGN